MRPGNYALGSPQSRAAARSLLVARKASEEDEPHFEAVSILDGSRLIEGLQPRAGKTATGERSQIAYQSESEVPGSARD
jgi:hypothetical protein